MEAAQEAGVLQEASHLEVEACSEVELQEVGLQGVVL